MYDHEVSSRINALTQRIGQLEADNRRLALLWFSGKSLTIMVLLLVLGIRGTIPFFTPSRIVTNDIVANNVVVNGEDGQTRIIVGNSNKGNALIRLFDSDGRARWDIATDSDGNGYLQAYDSNDARRLHLGVTNEGYADLSIMDSSGKRRVSLSTPGYEDGIPSVTLYNRNEQERAYMAFVDGHGVLRVADEDKSSVYITTGDEGRITLYDEDERPVWFSPDELGHE